MKIIVTKETLLEIGIERTCEGYKWFCEKFPKGYSGSLKKLCKLVENKEWLAYCLYKAVIDFSDERYDERIIDALIETKNAEYLYFAGKYFFDKRYDKRIYKVLVETKDTFYIE